MRYFFPPTPRDWIKTSCFPQWSWVQWVDREGELVPAESQICSRDDAVEQWRMFQRIAGSFGQGFAFLDWDASSKVLLCRWAPRGKKGSPKFLLAGSITEGLAMLLALPWAFGTDCSPDCVLHKTKLLRAPPPPPVKSCLSCSWPVCKPPVFPWLSLCSACTTHVWGEAWPRMLGVSHGLLSCCCLGCCCCIGPPCDPVLGPPGHCSLASLCDAFVPGTPEIHFYCTCETLPSCGWVHVLHLWPCCSSELTVPAWERRWFIEESWRGRKPAWEKAGKLQASMQLHQTLPLEHALSLDNCTRL